MLWEIALREFKENIISIRFKVALGLCLLLIPMSVLVSIKNFEGKQRVYEVEKAHAEEINQPRVYSFLRPEIIKPLEPLSIFSNGISFNVGSKVKIRMGEVPAFTEGKTIVRENPFTNRFMAFDFVTALAILLSLLGLLFSYDCCTREKETGTFKVVFSNPVSRASLLGGKLTGMLFTFIPILLLVYTISIVILWYLAPVSLGVNDWLGIVLLLFFSLIYLQIFSVIGILISAKSSSSKRSIVITLITWITFLFIIPNLAGYVAQGLVNVQSYDNMVSKLREYDEQFFKEVDEYEEKISPGQGQGYWNYWSDEDGQEQIFGTKKSTYEFQRDLNEFEEPLRIEYADKKWRVKKAYFDEINTQRKTAEYLSYLSPSELFRAIGSALCKTDFTAHQHFMQSVRNYRLTFIQYYRDNNIFSSYTYFTRVPPEKFTEDFSFRYDEQQEQEQRAERDPNYYEPLDLSDVPVFEYHRVSVTDSILTTTVQMSGLILLGLLLFYLSFRAFIRFDIR
jgi:ABC-type transport system involved in multi-copper enzyme maturation permease subunit